MHILLYYGCVAPEWWLSSLLAHLQLLADPEVTLSPAGRYPVRLVTITRGGGRDCGGAGPRVTNIGTRSPGWDHLKYFFFCVTFIVNYYWPSMRCILLH